MLWDPEILASVRACLLVFFRVFSWCCFQLFRRRSRGNLWKRSNWSLVGTAKGVIFTLSFIVRTTLRLPVRLVKHKMLSWEKIGVVLFIASVVPRICIERSGWAMTGPTFSKFIEHQDPNLDSASLYGSLFLFPYLSYSLSFSFFVGISWSFSRFLVLFRTMCHHIILMWTFYFMFVRIWRTHRIFIKNINIYMNNHIYIYIYLMHSDDNFDCSL